MKYLFLCFKIVVISFTPLKATEDWGQTGHRVTAQVAEHYLTEKAKVKISELLEGKSMAMVSNDADYIKSDRNFDIYRPWHYVNIPFEKYYFEIEPSSQGDLIQAIEICKNVIKDEKSTQDQRSFYLKLLIHFVGDLHQPLHLGIEDDKGANDFQVLWFNESTNLHAVWDSSMIDHYQLSYTELTADLPEFTIESIVQYTKGTVIEWAEEIRTLTKQIYHSSKMGDKLGYRYMYEYFALVKQQLKIGGIRLAYILNELFE